MPLIVGIFAVAAAAGLLAGDEERGTLDLTLSYPVVRTSLFWGRWLAYAVALALVLFIGYLGWAVTLPFSSMGVTALGLLRPFLPLWALLLLFGGLALLLSMVLPSARIASMTAGGLLVANFLLLGLANLNEDLQAVMEYTPFHFFQMGDAIDGLKWGWNIGLAAVGFALAAAAWLLFRRRDIRVGGERGWSWRPRVRMVR
jgi:ABC-2 type transport system permease protein